MNRIKAESRKKLTPYPCGIFITMVAFAVWSMVWDRYVLYHSQNWSLRPDDYEIQVVTADDYRALADPRIGTVHLANGTEIMKAAAWDASVFKPIEDGARYVKVTTKGTAHVLVHTMPILGYFLITALVGMFLTWPRNHKDGQLSRSNDSNTTSD